MKTTITKIKPISEGVNGRLDKVVGQIRDLGDKEPENAQLEQKANNLNDSLRDSQNNIKYNNIYFTEVPEEEERHRD